MRKDVDKERRRKEFGDIMKKRILLMVCASCFTISCVCKPLAREPENYNDFGSTVFEEQTISDINNVSFDLVEDESPYTQESEIDYTPERVQLELELNRQLEELDQIEDMYEWFKKYKELREEFSSIFEEEFEHEQITDAYTEDEIYYIERMVETETHGCSFEAHVNVANVVFNRIEHEKFPNTPIGVVTAGGQFCYGATKISESVKLAVEYAFMFPDTTNGAIYFHSGHRTKTFNKKPLVHEDDAVHYFYG